LPELTSAIHPADPFTKECVMTQQPPPGNYPPPSGGTQPSNHLVWAILTTLFCCLPLGIVSIVKSAQVSGLWASGRYAEAQQAADSAKKWAMWSAILGVIGIVIYIIIAIAGGMFAATN